MLKKVLHYRIRRTTLVIVVSLALMAGVGLAARLPEATVWWCWLALPFVVLSLRRQNIILLGGLVIIAVCIGWWKGSIYQHKLAVYQQIAGQKVVLVGHASSDAVYGKNSQMEFDMRDARVVAPVQAPLVGSLTVSGFGEPMIYKGDQVAVVGKVRPSRGNNVARVSYAQLEVIGRNGSLVDDIRRKFSAGLQSALPEPAASFGLGILVGQRDTMPETVKEQLKAVGLTHIVAVSGYNLMIILRASGRFLRDKSKYQYVLVSGGLVGSFLLFAGSSPSIVRASVVCGIGLAAWYYGRNIKPLTLLLVAAAITAYANPLYIWGNVSWYLSFLAFFGVLVVAPLFMQRVFGNKSPPLLVAILIESLSAEFATLPYTLYIFGQFSFVGILANVLVVALVPLAMLCSLIAGLAGTFVGAVAGWFAWPATTLITYMLDISAILSRVPHAFVDNIGFSLPMMLTGYAILLFILTVLYHQNKRKYGIITDKIDPASPI